MNTKKLFSVMMATLFFSLAFYGDAYAKSVNVKCEYRAKSPIRSKASVDGTGFPKGVKYRAQIKSAAGTKTSKIVYADPVTHEIQVDFDSDLANINAGATAIPANFFAAIPRNAIGYIRNDATGVIEAFATATCSTK